MKRALSLLAAVGVLTATRPAPAVESRGDVETDHLDATDDGGPRAAGVFVHPFGMAMAGSAPRSTRRGVSTWS